MVVVGTSISTRVTANPTTVIGPVLPVVRVGDTVPESVRRRRVNPGPTVDTDDEDGERCQRVGDIDGPSVCVSGGAETDGQQVGGGQREPSVHSTNIHGGGHPFHLQSLHPFPFLHLIRRVSSLTLPTPPEVSVSLFYFPSAHTPS